VPLSQGWTRGTIVSSLQIRQCEDSRVLVALTLKDIWNNLENPQAPRPLVPEGKTAAQSNRAARGLGKQQD